MLRLVTLALTAGLALAQTGQPGQPAKNAEAPSKAPTEPPAPTPIPVPNNEPVKKAELEGGLLVEDLKIGDGYEVKPGGVVVALYHGTFKSDGKVFDSAFERGEPISFPLSGVIEGWKKGVPGMKVGGIRKLTVPYTMAYGEEGRPPKIPAKADLVFVIQLVDALQVEDVKVGEGEAVAGQSVAVTTHLIKDKDGKEVEKCDTSKPYIWFPNEFMPISLGLEGMKPGGKRKIIVPKEMNQGAPGSSRPTGVPLTIELELIAARNLQQRR